MTINSIVSKWLRFSLLTLRLVVLISVISVISTMAVILFVYHDAPSEPQIGISMLWGIAMRYCRKSCSFEMKKGGVSCW
jgi:hypothetical protein